MNILISELARMLQRHLRARVHGLIVHANRGSLRCRWSESIETHGMWFRWSGRNPGRCGIIRGWCHVQGAVGNKQRQAGM